MSLWDSISVEHWLTGYVSPTCSKYETCSGGSNPWSYVFQDYLTSYSEYTTKERAKMGRYGTKNGPAKAARHFSQLYMAILPWGLRHTVKVTSFFGWGTKSPNLKVANFKSTVLGKITKTNIRKIFPLYSIALIEITCSLAKVRLTPNQICPTKNHNVVYLEALVQFIL